jgi:putative redox protein
MLSALRLATVLPAERSAALHAVVSHCTIHNSLLRPPDVRIEVA